MGDEHVDRCHLHMWTDGSGFDHTDIVIVHPTNQYPCSSDQYTDTHVYAHGDDGDRAGE
jgi:hypothetical protein